MSYNQSLHLNPLLDTSSGREYMTVSNPILLQMGYPSVIPVPTNYQNPPQNNQGIVYRNESIVINQGQNGGVTYHNESLTINPQNYY